MATVFHHNYVRHFAAGVTEHRSIIGRASRVLSERDEPEPRRVALFRAQIFSEGAYFFPAIINEILCSLYKWIVLSFEVLNISCENLKVHENVEKLKFSSKKGFIPL